MRQASRPREKGPKLGGRGIKHSITGINTSPDHLECATKGASMQPPTLYGSRGMAPSRERLALSQAKARLLHVLRSRTDKEDPVQHTSQWESLQMRCAAEGTARVSGI